MVEELVFTSAKRGLEIGKSGFCTVASSSGMATNLARLLQSLSGYRHLHPPGSPAAALNPVVYSHLKSKVGGQSYSIFSRICDADIDYSNRSNKLAHHLALKGSVGVDFTPVEVLQNESQFFVQWDEEPRKLPPKTLTGHLSTAVPCATWASVTGDSGWAGDVVDAVLKNRPVFLIVDEQTPALKLISEAVSLLPRPKQRDVTFSTFFTKIPPNVECGIRCVMAGSPEVALGRRSQKNLVLDLTQPLGQSQSPHADAARTGMLIGGSTGNEFTNISTKPVTPPQQDALELEVDEEYYLKQAGLASSESGQSVPPAPPRSGRPTSKQPAKLGDVTPVKRSVLPWIIGLMLLLLVGGGAAVFAAMNLVNDSVQVASVDESESDVVTGNSEELSDGELTVEEAENDDADSESISDEPGNDSTSTEQGALKEQSQPDGIGDDDGEEPVEGDGEPDSEGMEDVSGAAFDDKSENESAGKVWEPLQALSDTERKSETTKPITSLTSNDIKVVSPKAKLSDYKDFKEIAVITCKQHRLKNLGISSADPDVQFEKVEDKPKWILKFNHADIGELVVKPKSKKHSVQLQFNSSWEIKKSHLTKIYIDDIPIRLLEKERKFAQISPNFETANISFDIARPNLQFEFTEEATRSLNDALTSKFEKKFKKLEVTLKTDCELNEDKSEIKIGFEIGSSRLETKIALKLSGKSGKLEVGVGKVGFAEQITKMLDARKSNVALQLKKKLKFLKEKKNEQKELSGPKEARSIIKAEIEKIGEEINVLEIEKEQIVNLAKTGFENQDFRKIVLPVCCRDPNVDERFYIVSLGPKKPEEINELIDKWEEENLGGSK